MKEKKRHASLERLLDVAHAAKVDGPAALAKAFNQSEQTLTNWGARGVSKFGAMKAQDKFGCNANWILTGLGSKFVSSVAPMTISEKNGTVTRMDQRRPPSLDQLLKDLSVYFVGLDEPARRRVKSQLADLVDAPEDHNSLAEIMAITLKTGNAKPSQERLENSTSSHAG